MELDQLQKRAKAAGMYCNRHKACDPLSGGDLYLMEAKRFKTAPMPPTILKFVTAEQIHKALTTIEGQR
jgi:hypothetical protein